MRKRNDWLSIAIVASLASLSNGGVIITEIMYNPAGADPGTATSSGEWVEIYNDGPASIDLSGWRLDDEDATDWGALPSGATLAAGEVAVITTTAGEFHQSWGAAIKVFAVTWAALANTASDTNEVLVLRDSSQTVMDTANYEAGTNGWPPSTNGRSIYLADLTLDNNLGSSWALSQAGVSGAYSPAAPVAPYHASDVGSPGLVPEPASLLMLAGLLSWSVSRRRICVSRIAQG